MLRSTKGVLCILLVFYLWEGGSQAFWDKVLTFANKYFTAFFSYDWGDAD